MSKIFFDKIPVIRISDSLELQFKSLVKDIQNKYSIVKAKEIDMLIFDLYRLDPLEQQTIGFVEIE